MFEPGEKVSIQYFTNFIKSKDRSIDKDDISKTPAKPTDLFDIGSSKMVAASGLQGKYCNCCMSSNQNRCNYHMQLADFPAVFFILLYETDKYKYQKMKIRVSCVGQSTSV